VTATTIRSAFATWPQHNSRLRDVVAAMSAANLAIQPTPERWPLWASIGHLACQRVFGLCDVLGEPGKESTPFPNAAYNCPGDDDLEHVLSAGELAAALDTTFVIVERCLDTWTLEMLDEVIAHPEWGPDWVNTRGFTLQRAYSHDIYHIAELNEALSANGLPLVDLWE
jgi:hypothetical protein